MPPTAEIPDPQPWPDRRGWRVLVLVAAVSAALLLAWRTPVGDPPDELDHLAGIRYFQEHAWPPPPGSDDVFYTVFGTARVYNGEWSYWLLGRLSGTAAKLVPAAGEPFALRLWSVAALVALLAPLLFWPSRLFRLERVGLFLACVPQLLYVCSYVNGDAWTVAASVWLLRLGLAIYERPEARRELAFGVVLGLALGTKPTAWLIVPFALAAAVAGWRRLPRPPWRRLALAALACVALIAPLRLRYPAWSQGWGETGTWAEVRLRHAAPEYDPRHPSAAGYLLRARGVSFGEVILSADWWKRTAASSYAMFGSMDRVPPRALLVAAAALWLLLLAVGIEGRLRSGPLEPARARVLAACALAVAATVLTSAWQSWSYSYQPQGRYLFCALAPFALLLCGTDLGRPRLRTAALGGLAALAVLVLLWLALASYAD